MTDFKLPVIRHLTADEVEPGMTIAGRLKDTRVYGVADSQYDTGSWFTADGQSLGWVSYGYDLLAEAPKPEPKLPCH